MRQAACRISTVLLTILAALAMAAEPPPAAAQAAAADATTNVEPRSSSSATTAPDMATLATTLKPDVPGREAIAAFYTRMGRPVWTRELNITEAGRALAGELTRAADFGLEPTAFELPAATGARFATADEQAAYDLALTRAALLYARHARGSRVDPPRLSGIIDVRPSLPDDASVLDALARADDPAQTLRAYHPPHPGFRNLAAALVAARTANAAADTVQRIVVNLERWRWLPQDLGAMHVINNVPEQVTRLVKAGDIVFSERIVVGKPQHATPLMSAIMQQVIFHPSWGVPNGIKTNEVAPMLRRASQNSGWFGGGRPPSEALARHELRVYQNGREVDPDQIDWRAVDIRNFHFTQPPSARNVLGVVKFRFPNRFDVYMHDTQERHLFRQSVRAFSHGCMRVENPLRLAEVLLAHDKGWSADRVHGMVRAGRSVEVDLDTPIPVHLTYFTVTADEEGKLTQHGDIYGMDARVATALAGKPIALATARATSEPASGPRARNRPAATAQSTGPRFDPRDIITAN